MDWARPAHGRSQVSCARREPPGGHLPGRPGRRSTDDVREPARRDGPRVLACRVARPARHLDGAPAPGRPRADPGRPRPAQRDGPALEPRVPADRERRSRRLVPRRRDAGARRRRPAAALAGRPARHHRAQGRRGRAARRPRRARTPGRRTHRRARGGERDDGARDRRASARRGRPPDRRASIPGACRADPRRDLHLGGEPPRGRALDVLHQPPDRAAPRLHGRRVARARGLLDLPPSSGRPKHRRRGVPALGEHGGIVRDGVPLPAQGRAHRLGGRPGHPDRGGRTGVPGSSRA